MSQDSVENTGKDPRKEGKNQRGARKEGLRKEILWLEGPKLTLPFFTNSKTKSPIPRAEERRIAVIDHGDFFPKYPDGIEQLSTPPPKT